MTLPTEQRRLGDELDRLDERLDELAEMLSEAEAGTASAEVLQRTANEIDTQGGAVARLVSEHGPDATVTVKGLTAGGYARVEDRTAAMRSQSNQPGGLPGSSRNVWAAAGLVEAPFYDGDPDDLDEKITAVANQPIGVVKWLEGAVNDVSTVSEGNWKPLQQRQADATTN